MVALIVLYWIVYCVLVFFGFVYLPCLFLRWFASVLVWVLFVFLLFCFVMLGFVWRLFVLTCWAGCVLMCGCLRCGGLWLVSSLLCLLIVLLFTL